MRLRPLRAALLPFVIVATSSLSSAPAVDAGWKPCFKDAKPAMCLDPSPTPTPRPTPTITPSPSPSAGPVISSVAATDITTTSASIAWHVSEPATGQVEYGPTIAYGQRSTLEASFAYVDHLQALSGLTPITLYHYRVVSVDVDGNVAVSTDRMFRTLSGASSTPSPLPTPTPPPVPLPTPTPTPRPLPTPTPAPPRTCPASLQAAIDAAPDGATLDLTGCAFTSTGPVTISGRSGLTLIGGLLRSSGYHSAFVVACSSSVTLRGWSITGSHLTPGTYVLGQEDAHGVEVRGGSNLRFEGLDIVNMQGDGFYFAQCGTTNGSGATVQDSRVSANGRMGIAVVAFNGVSAYRMRFEDIAFRPIDVEPDCNAAYQQQAQDLVFDGGTVTGWIRKDPDGTVHGTSWLYIGTPSCAGGFAPRVGRISVRHHTVDPTSPFAGLWSDISPSGYRVTDVLIEANVSSSTWAYGGGVIRARGCDRITVQDNRQRVTSGPFVAATDCTGVVELGNATG